MAVAIRAITRLQDADDAALFAGQGWLTLTDVGEWYKPLRQGSY